MSTISDDHAFTGGFDVAELVLPDAAIAFEAEEVGRVAGVEAQDLVLPHADNAVGFRHGLGLCGAQVGGESVEDGVVFEFGGYSGHLTEYVGAQFGR